MRREPKRMQLSSWPTAGGYSTVVGDGIDIVARGTRQRSSGAALALVIVVLVSHVPGGWRVAHAFEDLFDPVVLAVPELAALVPRFSMIVADLARLPTSPRRPLPAFPRLALWLLRDARDSERLLDSFDGWVPAMLELGRTRSGRDRFTT